MFTIDKKDAKQKFAEFHRLNPEVYTTFERMAVKLLKTRTRIGAKAIMERVRWETATKTEGGEFKIDNTLTAHYSRLFMSRHPEYVNCFEIRKTTL